MVAESEDRHVAALGPPVRRPGRRLVCLKKSEDALLMPQTNSRGKLIQRAFERIYRFSLREWRIKPPAPILTVLLLQNCDLIPPVRLTIFVLGETVAINPDLIAVATSRGKFPCGVSFDSPNRNSISALRQLSVSTFDLKRHSNC